MDPLQTAGASQPHQPPHSSHAQHHRNARRCAATTSLNPTTSIFLPTPKRPSNTAVSQPIAIYLPSRRDQLASHAKRVSQQHSSPNPAVPASPYRKHLTLIFSVAESSPSKCRPKVSSAKIQPARRAPSAEPPTTSRGKPRRKQGAPRTSHAVRRAWLHARFLLTTYSRRPRPCAQGKTQIQTWYPCPEGNPQVPEDYRASSHESTLPAPGQCALLNCLVIDWIL